jgi:hypothetical protein
MRTLEAQPVQRHKDMNKLKINLYFELLKSGKNRNVLRILSRDKDIKEEVHKELRKRSKGVQHGRPRRN